ncbi:cytoplasmic protein [Planctomycetota bacterium]|nr:cytoplasmic protein [Planctomycetota bacterium]
MEQFVSEPITPKPGTFNASAIARGEPGLPTHFTWRKEEYRVDEILEVWKASTAEGGSGEMYLRRHYFKVRTTSRHVMTLYCERQQKRKNAKARWFLYTMNLPEDE